jgi:hypothetical protein
VLELAQPLVHEDPGLRIVMRMRAYDLDRTAQQCGCARSVAAWNTF